MQGKAATTETGSQVVPQAQVSFIFPAFKQESYTRFILVHRSSYNTDIVKTVS